MTVHPSHLALIFALVVGTLPVSAQSLVLDSKTGEEIYRIACAACHGADGRGNPRSVVGFETPLPDFADCAFATPETDADWMSIVREGGPARAFARHMPAFGQALSEAVMQKAVDYLRRFCGDRRWPRGELNLPRPLVTEKAFPENETIVSVSVTGGEFAAIGNTLVYERRLGARSQVELAVPLEIQKGATGDWQRGLGDASVAFKQVLFHSLDSGTIVSGGAELVFPTAKHDAGFGGGTSVVEPFVAIGQTLQADGFLQVQSGLELPAQGAREAFVRAAVGRSFTMGSAGRSWAPMIEIAGARDVEEGAAAEWDVVPQMQVSLSRRQHVLACAGLRVPLTSRNERRIQLLTYFLWDWFDGGLFSGWR